MSVERGVRESRSKLVKEIFQQAAEMTPPQRERFLLERCAQDGSMKKEIEKLLSCDAEVKPRFLQTNADTASPRVLPKRIGRFEIIRLIGEGGMGTVFEARQEHPRRTVALKIIRMAMASESVRRRFEQEVQTLGQLKHRGIAQIYEAGTDQDGSGAPYFAMELVQGPSLLEFAKERKLSTSQRLELAAEICDAVHHAHQKGVVHRDLKPANILVESQGGIAQPKILDFGVARATHSDMQQVTMHTEVGQIVGTLSYMSPEQVAGRSAELDVRSDVYALGVILYELLAERLPYDLRGRSMPEICGIIRDQEPSRLSSVHSAFRGDIETIVAKALAKEKERRYQSAAELAEDIRRFLRDEPIVARPTSRAYQIRKFAKRNKALVGGVVAVFVVLVIGLIGIGWALVRAKEAEQAALRSAAKATAVNNFLQNMLAGVDPENIGPNALTVREVLDHASARLEKELADQPDVAASVHQTLGRHYSTLGFFIEADRHLSKAVELRKNLAQGDDPELAEALFFLAANLQEKRDIEEAEAPTREALDMRRRLFGPESLQVADSLYDLASILIDELRPAEAEPLARQSLEIRRKLLGPQHAGVATSVGMLGWCLMALGRLDEAENALREAVDMVRRLPGDNERALAARLTFLSYLLRTRGKYVEEEAVLREAIDIRSRRLAQDHPALAWNLLRLAQVRRRMGDLNEAESACRRALEIYVKKRGPEHADVADCQQLLAQIYEDRGRFDEAQAWWSSCLEMRRKLLPVDHPDIVFAESSLAGIRATGEGKLGTSKTGEQ